MDPALQAKIQLAQAFAGDEAHNPGSWEAYFYLYWSAAFLSLFPTSDIHVGPQYVLSTTQVDNDGVTKKKTKVPDFGLVYLKGVQIDFPPRPAIDEVRTYEDLNAFFRGPYKVEDYSLLVICEVKGFPNIEKHFEEGDDLTVALQRTVAARFAEARAGARTQSKVLFSAHEEIEGIALTVCVGDYFSWTRCDRQEVSELSQNVDGTYRPKLLNAVYSRSTVASRAKQVSTTTMTLRSPRARKPNPRYTASGSTEPAAVTRASRRAAKIATGSKGKGKAPEVPRASTSKQGQRSATKTRAAPQRPADYGDSSSEGDPPSSTDTDVLKWSHWISWLAVDAEDEKDRLRAAIKSYNPGRDLS
ncbi:hypothetical protein A0H81_06857 [Grifola frondosa]|uniref:Uncharacterized protein n=1 Tax=Grifola frondosa TaxID=5627 RepID=A0A1C7M8J1_GRIFR|nr:hypothetical protein A0H81_06857 [Grifola frondosa]